MIGDNDVLGLHSKGYSNRRIAKILDTNYKIINKKAMINGLVPNGGSRNKKIQMVSASLAVCSKCGQTKSIEEFQINRKAKKYEYRIAYCNECRKKQLYDNLNSDVTKYLSQKYCQLRRRCEKSNIKFEITKEEFIQRFFDQEGKCFYTDEELDTTVGTGKKKNSASIDKIIPASGYVVGNFVFCCNRINTCKNDLSLEEIKKWMPEWGRRIEEFFQGNI